MVFGCFLLISVKIMESQAAEWLLIIFMGPLLKNAHWKLGFFTFIDGIESG